MIKPALIVMLVLMLSGCAWDSDYRERKQPEDYLEQTEPPIVR